MYIFHMEIWLSSVFHAKLLVFTVSKCDKFGLGRPYLIMEKDKVSETLDFCSESTRLSHTHTHTHTHKLYHFKNAVFWDVASCRSCGLNRRFGGKYRLHLQGRKFRERGTSVIRWLQTADRSWVQISLEAWMFVCVSSVFLLLCV
jgi:hypothetical protein